MADERPMSERIAESIAHKRAILAEQAAPKVAARDADDEAGTPKN